MSSEGKPILVQWDILTHDLEGKLLSESSATNLVVNTGRTQLLGLAFVPSLSSSGGFYSLGVGASAIAASVTDTRLTYELIGNSTRKLLTDTSGLTPTNTDIVLETTTIGGCTFYEKIVLQAVFSAGDGNNGATFNEYGIFTSNALPASPTGISGNMFNHYIDPSPVTKSGSNQVTAIITIRM